jgi:HTH-type transcriptional regulator/antitoxin HigA
MNLKIIKTEKDYQAAVGRIHELMNSEKNQIEPGSSKGDELELLALLVERYEDDQFPKKAPDPIDAIRFRMDQMNLIQKDIAPLLGGETRASEVLNGRRHLTLKMIAMLNHYLDIPLESMIRGNKSYKLEASRKRMIMSVPALRDFLVSKNSIVG